MLSLSRSLSVSYIYCRFHAIVHVLYITQSGFQLIFPSNNLYICWSNISNLRELPFVTSTLFHSWDHEPLTRYVKLWAAHASGMLGTFSPPPASMEPLVRDPGMHHGTCVSHLPWCMSGLLTCFGGGKRFPAFPAYVQPAILRIWLEAQLIYHLPSHVNVNMSKMGAFVFISCVKFYRQNINIASIPNYELQSTIFP